VKNTYEGKVGGRGNHVREISGEVDKDGSLQWEGTSGKKKHVR
jgi:hypothetical protein